MNKKIFNKIKYLIPPLIVIIILLILFFIKGIYPFGENSIAYADMGQGEITWANYFYDVIMNKANIFYSNNLGTGSNTYMRLESFSITTWLHF